VDALIERIRARIAAGRPCDHPGEWLPVQRPATPAALADAEAALGFRLPGLLRTLYVEVGNGGFGPVFGLLPLSRASLGDDPPAEADFDLLGQYDCGATAPAGRDGAPGWCRLSTAAVPSLNSSTVTTPTQRSFRWTCADMEEWPPVPSLAGRLEMWLAGEQPW